MTSQCVVKSACVVHWFILRYIACTGSAKFRYKSLRFARRALDDVMLLDLYVLVERFPNPIKTSF